MGQIHELIPKIMAEVDAIPKARRNQQQNFMFRGIEDVYQHLQRLLAKHCVSVVPYVLTSSREARQTANGKNLYYTLLTVKYTLYAPDGSFVEAAAEGEGMDSGDKATPKAMSGAHKTCLLQLFLIPTEDAIDPDKDSPDGDDDVQATVSANELGVLRDLIKQTGAVESEVCNFLKVDRLEDLLSTGYRYALGALNAKAKKQAKP